MNYYIFNNRIYLKDESKATPGVCPHCNSKLAYNAKYCGKCGYGSPFYDKNIKVERKTIPCPTCGDTLHIDMEKCNTCGRINLSKLANSFFDPPKKEDGYRYCWYCKNYVEVVHYCPICGIRCDSLDLVDD